MTTCAAQSFVSGNGRRDGEREGGREGAMDGWMDGWSERGDDWREGGK